MLRSGGCHRDRRWRSWHVGIVLVLALALAAAGFGVDTVALGTASSRSRPPATLIDPATTASTTTVAVTTTSTLPPPSEPGGGQTLLPGHRIVAFYGAPGGGSLGVLGRTSPEATWPALLAQAAPYAQAGTPVLPAYELITYVAQGSPGPDDTYSAKLPDTEINQYLPVVQAHDGLLILDIQPGRSSMLADAESLAPYLARPDVALAIDSEWEVDSDHLPGQVIGHTTAAEINEVSTWLEGLTVSDHLPQKLLLIHQFTDSMVEDKEAVMPQRRSPWCSTWMASAASPTRRASTPCSLPTTASRSGSSCSTTRTRQ